MRSYRPDLINEEFYAESVSPAVYDQLLAAGWRHFGYQFFRYNFGIHQDEIRRVLPLRIRLADFEPSRSQRRVLRRNADLSWNVEPVRITDEIEYLFHRHKARFSWGVPSSIYDFISVDADARPTRGYQLTLRLDDRLLAASFFDLGANGLSAIYACFEPSETSRSLGIFTMLKVIDHARSLGFAYYYHGYAYEGESFYDYKKRFAALERFDWAGRWLEFMP